MLLFDRDRMLTRWAGERLGIADFSPCAAIGVAHRGEVVAAAIYNNYRPPNIEITFVTSSPRWASKGAIRAMLRYPFVQLGCARLTAVTPAQNRQLRHLGNALARHHQQSDGGPALVDQVRQCEQKSSMMNSC